MGKGGFSGRRRVAILAAIFLWSLAIGWGFLFGFWYEITPTETGDVVKHWPADSGLVLSRELPTLLMFVHPRCPCSRASLSELSLLMADCQGTVNVEVLFFQPDSISEDWVKTDLWDSAAGIPGVIPQSDPAGNEHRRFGVRVSGEVFLFLPSGELAFHGGITAGRGHSGDNQGRDALEAFLGQQSLPTASTPVFGCELECPHVLVQNSSSALEEKTNP